MAVLIAGIPMLVPTPTACQIVDSYTPGDIAGPSHGGLLGEAVSVQDFQGAMVAWEADKPGPGTMVKVKVRGEVLVFLLQEPENWKLISGENKLAVALVPASLPAQARKDEYEFAITEINNRKTLQLDIDRGDAARPLSRLEVHFAATRYSGRVKVTTSADQETYRPAGKQQVVYQEITGGQVLRLGEIELDQNPERYLRLEIPNPSSGGIKAVKGWFAAPYKLEAYKTEAVLGPMGKGGGLDESVWPILMDPMSLPIAKLKVLADEPGEVRRMHLSTMDGADLGTAVGQETIWASGLTQNYDQISNKWITLKGQPTSGPFAVVVSGDGNPLQLSGVEVYLLEHWLVFEMPGAGDPQLWKRDTDEPRPESAIYSIPDLQAAVFAGTITEWDIAKPLAAGPGAQQRWIDPPLEYVKSGGWLVRMYAYIALALVLLIAGTAMLRREVRHQRKG